MIKFKAEVNKQKSTLTCSSGSQKPPLLGVEGGGSGVFNAPVYNSQVDLLIQRE